MENIKEDRAYNMQQISSIIELEKFVAIFDYTKNN